MKYVIPVTGASSSGDDYDLFGCFHLLTLNVLSFSGGHQRSIEFARVELVDVAEPRAIMQLIVDDFAVIPDSLMMSSTAGR